MKKDKTRLAKVTGIAVSAAILIPVVSTADAIKAYVKSVAESYKELYRVVIEAFSD